MKIIGQFQTSVSKALSEIDPKWRDYPGLIVCGGHNPETANVEMILDEIKEAREKSLPFLGICLGHQLAAIEYARNVLGIKDATSEEFGTPGTPIVRKLPELNVGLKQGESNWNNFAVDPKFLEEWDKALNFLTVQFHPEYESSFDKPHPLLIKFLQYAKVAV